LFSHVPLLSDILILLTEILLKLAYSIFFFVSHTDLVHYIKKNYGSDFCTSVAGYPEGTEMQKYENKNPTLHHTAQLLCC
jgi:Methylenetetrahydrofolate reductase